MTPSWRKVIRDFWRERARTSLVVVAIALGIVGFASMLAASAILSRELDRGYLASNPASANFRTDKVDDELVAAILENPQVSDAEPRRVIYTKIKVGPISWRTLILFVVKDYADIRVSRLVPEQGAWPPATGELLLERDAMQVARAKIGDTLTIKTNSDQEHGLLLTGTVYDVGQAQARMENVVYGYITLATLERLGEEPYLNQLNLLVAENQFDEQHIRRVAADVKNLIEGQGHPVHHVNIPEPGKHIHGRLMGMLLLAMSTFGILILVLAGILVVNLITSLMAAQVRQIGVMKAIGGTRWQIARIYFGQAVLLGAAAVLVAAPLAVLGTVALCQYMARLLNFNIESYAVPAWVYLLVAAVGLAAPLLAAAWPVWKGSGVSVRVALSDFGVADCFGTSFVDRLLVRVGGRFRTLVLAIRNSFRRRTRLVLTLLTLALGGVCFLTALNVRSSMIRTIDRIFAPSKFDLTVVMAKPYPREKIDRALKNTPGITAAEGWFTIEGALVEARPPDGEHEHTEDAHAGGHVAPLAQTNQFSVIALPVDTRLFQFDLSQGRVLAADDRDAIVVNETLADKGKITLGETITLALGPAQMPFRVVGIARVRFAPAEAYLPLSVVDQFHPGSTNSVRLALDDPSPLAVDRLKLALEENLKTEGLRATACVSKGDGRYAFDQHMLMMYVFLMISSGVIACVGGLGLATTMSVNVIERRREMGVLRAVGATPLSIWLIVVAEAIAVGAMSWILASLAAWPVSRMLGNMVGRMMFRGGIDFVFEPLGLLIWLAISMVLGTLASFLPAWRASRMTVREALAYE